MEWNTSGVHALWVIGLTDTMRIVVGWGGDISSMPALWVIGLTDTMRIVVGWGGGGERFLVCLLCG